MKSLLPYTIILVFLLIAAFTISQPTDKESIPQDIYATNKITPQQLPKTKDETQDKVSIAKILESIKPITASLNFKNIVVNTNIENNTIKFPIEIDSSPIEIPESQDQTTFLDQVNADLFASPFGGSTLSQQCGGGSAPVAGIGKTFSGVIWAYDVCSPNSPEIEPSHPFPACVSANYACPPPSCFCTISTFSVNERDIMYPIVTTGASAVYPMTKTKCTCAPVACNVICSPRAWTWDSATNTCVCS